VGQLPGEKVVRVAGCIEITTSDLRRLLDVVDPARAGESGELLPYSLLHDIADLVPCDDVSFEVIDPYQRVIAGQGDRPDPDGGVGAKLAELWWPAFWESCSYPQRSGDYTSVTRESDALPGVRKGPKWAAFAEARGGHWVHGVMLCLPPAGTVDHRLQLWRESGPDFSDRDVLILTLLRPHVTALYQHHRALRVGTPDLTPRQWEILRLVAMGSTNRQIARALVLSEATVRKHMENIYTRLDVGNRTAALARCGEILQPA
jgi:DNA-binding CsgD family transcriptional regulator